MSVPPCPIAGEHYFIRESDGVRVCQICGYHIEPKAVRRDRA